MAGQEALVRMTVAKMFGSKPMVVAKKSEMKAAWIDGEKFRTLNDKVGGRFISELQNQNTPLNP